MVSYTEAEKDIFKRNKFKARDLFLMELAIKDTDRINKELERFKQTFKDNPESLSILEQFVYSFVFNRSGLLYQGEKLREIKKLISNEREVEQQ